MSYQRASNAPLQFRRRFLSVMAGLPLGLTLETAPLWAGSGSVSSSLYIPLQDGRVLGARRLGIAGGLPVVYLHGSPSCGLEALILQSACQQIGVELWALDRPGIGLSSSCSNTSVTRWSGDVAQFVGYVQRHFGIGQMGLVATSVGTPYSLAIAAAMPETFPAVAIFAPRTPFAPGVAVKSVDRKLQQVIRHPRMAAMALRLLRKKLARGENLQVTQLLRDFSPVDQHFAQCHSGWLRCVYLEATRCGAWGVVGDMMRGAWPWCLDLSEIKSAVHCWRGSCDTASPPSTNDFLASRLARFEVTQFEGEGHLTLLEAAAPDVFRWLKRHVPTERPF